MALAGVALQHFHCFIQLIIHRVLGLRFLICGGSSIFIIWTDRIVRRVCNENVGRDRHILYGLPAGRVVFRDRQDQGAAIGQVERLLHRAVAKSLVADNVTARVFEDRGRDNLGCARSSPVYQNCDGKSCNRFCRIGIEMLTEEISGPADK